MEEDRYGKVLTVILVVVVIAIVILLGILGYDYWQKYHVTKDAEEFVDEFEEEVPTPEENNEENNEEDNEKPEENQANNQSSSTNYGTGVTYYEFTALGTMSIPKINFKYPVLQEQTQAALNRGVSVLYGVGLNKPGNTVIIGHNYRNGAFFSNNKKLAIGDKIYITDYSGKKLTYTIYNKFETTPEDTSFYTRNTGGKAEITLSTCTDDNKSRLIILAKAD